ncbi:MAG: hypothetical protein ACI909_002979 [Planctomycetota bacterium]|jgi:uncharacterized protein (TIGR02466 family)
MTTPANQDQATSKLPPLLQQAITEHQAGNLDAALPLYTQFLATYPLHPTALQLMGLLQSQRGEYDKAIELMRESLRQFPQQAEVANNLGNALSSSGKLDEAIESYAEAVKLRPNYVNALQNLGLSYLEQARYDLAEQVFQKCLELQPDNALAYLGLGNLFKRQDDIDMAIHYLEKALKCKPDYAEAHHNLGVCLRLKQKPSEAIEHYQSARQHGLDRAEMYQNLASAYVDMHDTTAALKAYRMAIERNPEDVISHRDLNKLLWEQELLEDHLQSYRDALKKYPTSTLLVLDYGIALNQQESHQEAEQIFLEGLRHSPDSSELKSLLAYTYEGLNDWDRALEMHADAVNSPNSIANHRVSYARALLARQRPEEALGHAEEAARQTPFDQRAIAYLGLCWRMLGMADDAFINDYEKFVQVYDVPVSPRFSNAGEFNQQLARVLDSLHIGKRHPPEQTLRGGTQTQGNLFDRSEVEIQELVMGLKLCIEDYIGKLAYNAAHPLLMRRGERYNFSASWSVRLQRSGYHTMHVHPLGWISSAYYVQLPSGMSESDSHGGGIKFGESDLDLGWRGKAARKIQPHMGRLVLFPSYMWHGTVPYDVDGPRMTVAFDVVPDHSQITAG